MIGTVLSCPFCRAGSARRDHGPDSLVRVGPDFGERESRGGVRVSVPIVPPGGITLPAGATSGVLPSPPRRADPLLPDAVVFYSACPGCGLTALWTEKRVHTHTEIAIDCRVCDQRDRRRLAASA